MTSSNLFSRPPENWSNGKFDFGLASTVFVSGNDRAEQNSSESTSSNDGTDYIDNTTAGDISFSSFLHWEISV
jgi:hypothetical protein